MDPYLYCYDDQIDHPTILFPVTRTPYTYYTAFYRLSIHQAGLYL
jgi:hypothetical protein